MGQDAGQSGSGQGCCGWWGCTEEAGGSCLPSLNRNPMQCGSRGCRGSGPCVSTRVCESMCECAWAGVCVEVFSWRECVQLYSLAGWRDKVLALRSGTTHVLLSQIPRTLQAPNSYHSGDVVLLVLDLCPTGLLWELGKERLGARLWPTAPPCSPNGSMCICFYNRFPYKMSFEAKGQWLTNASETQVGGRGRDANDKGSPQCHNSIS